MRKVGGIAGVMLSLGFLVSLDPVRGAFGFLFGWVVLAYLAWRAWPGIRGDIGRLRRRSPKRLGRYRGSFL